MSDETAPDQNRLLAALPRKELASILPHLKSVELRAGATLNDAGDRQQFVYFPTSGIVSMLTVLLDGSVGESAVIGNENAIGLALLMGGDSAPNRAVVQNEGHAYRISAALLLAEFGRGGMLQRVLLLYTQALIAQMGQNKACNRHHTLEQRFCKRLLVGVDLLGTHELRMTQQSIADILGTRREGVTETARKLQDRGCIQYRRGWLEVVDRACLEKLACECYGVVRRETHRLSARVRPQSRGAKRAA